MNLRDYQKDSIQMIRDSLNNGNKKIAVQIMTGSGKTRISREIIINALKNKNRVFFILKGNKLMNQTLKVFKDLPFGIIWAEKTRGLNKNLIFMSSQTYIMNPKKWKSYLDQGDLFVVDEAHDCTADGYKKLLSDIPEGKIVIGLSATFLRGASKRGHTFWEDFCTPITGAELRDQGWLPHLEIFCPPINYDLKDVKETSGDYNKSELYRAMSKSKTLFGDLIEQYTKLNPNREPAIAFCVNIKHSVDVAKAFKKIGVIALVIHSKLPKEEIDHFEENVQYYLNNKIPFVISSVDMLSRGVDIPQLKFGLMLRPTKSRRLFFQQVGRLTRKESKNREEKEIVTLLDFTPNTTKHGDPYGEVQPESRDIEKNARQKRGMKIRRCKKCGAVNPPHTSDCIVCGENMMTDFDITHSSGQLRKATFEEREGRVGKRLRAIMHFENDPKYSKMSKDYRYNDIAKRFGEKHFYSSKLISNEAKMRYAQRQADKKLKGK